MNTTIFINVIRLPFQLYVRHWTACLNFDGFVNLLKGNMSNEELKNKCKSYVGGADKRLYTDFRFHFQICFFFFLEEMDAFSLLEDLLNAPWYVKSNRPMLRASVAFICITHLVSSVSPYLLLCTSDDEDDVHESSKTETHRERKEKLFIALRLIVAIVDNVPLAVIRITFFSQLSPEGHNFVYIMFLGKEFLAVVGALMETFLEFGACSNAVKVKPHDDSIPVKREDTLYVISRSVSPEKIPHNNMRVVDI